MREWMELDPSTESEETCWESINLDVRVGESVAMREEADQTLDERGEWKEGQQPNSSGGSASASPPRSSRAVVGQGGKTSKAMPRVKLD